MSCRTTWGRGKGRVLLSEPLVWGRGGTGGGLAIADTHRHLYSDSARCESLRMFMVSWTLDLAYILQSVRLLQDVVGVWFTGVGNC